MSEYERHPPLDPADLAANPAYQFSAWLVTATEAGLHEPTAMALATANAAGQPSVRMVLFKGMDSKGGPTFATNLESRKGNEIQENGKVAAVFWWDVLERQVRVEGSCHRLTPEQDRNLFYSRPRISQIAAVTSRQSRVVANRQVLEDRFQGNVARMADSNVPMPTNWGGFAIEPRCWEFWQGRKARLHDRILYRRGTVGWTLERLEP